MKNCFSKAFARMSQRKLRAIARALMKAENVLGYPRGSRSAFKHEAFPVRGSHGKY